MNKSTKKYRIHRYTASGEKQQRFIPNEDPLPESDLGYSEWRMGAGPMAPEALAATRARNQILFTGVPKSAEQKEKMRARKLGVAKTEEHKANMGISQRARLARKAAA